jgi:hypothetical protein
LARPARSAPRVEAPRRSASRSFCPSQCSFRRISPYPLCEMRLPQRPCPRSSLSMRSACSGSRFSFSTRRAAFRHRLRQARGGVMSSSARPHCPSPGPSRDSAPPCGRPSSYGARSASPTLSLLSRWGPVGAGSTPGFRWTARQLANDEFALAHHSGLSGPNPVFHSHRYFHSAACQIPSLRAGACVARRSRPAEVGLKQRRRGTGLGVGSRFGGRRAGLWGTASKRRRATLPAGAPPPIPQADSVTPWGTAQPRSGRRRRSECAS